MKPKPSGPEEILARGCQVLDPILQEHGFQLIHGGTGVGSGGRFASCRYTRGDRSLELHYRHSLGMVKYHIGEGTLDHESFMRLLGVRDTCAFPDFPKEPIDSFRGLASDLKKYCSDFLNGSGNEFRALCIKANSEKRGFAELP